MSAEENMALAKLSYKHVSIQVLGKRRTVPPLQTYIRSSIYALSSSMKLSATESRDSVQSNKEAFEVSVSAVSIGVECQPSDMRN